MEHSEEFILKGQVEAAWNSPTTEFEGFGQNSDSDRPLPKWTKIHLENVILNANEFSKALNKIDTSEITSIYLENIEFSGEFQRVFLPNLTSFHFRTKKYRRDEDFRTSTILFFYKKEDEANWANFEFPNQSVNIKIIFESTLMYEINHDTKCLYLDLPCKEVENILNNLNTTVTVTLQNLGLTIKENHAQNSKEKFDLNLIPATVKIADLNVRGITWEIMEKFLFEQNIQEFIYKPKDMYDNGKENVVILKLPKSLKILSLSNCHLSVDDSYAGGELLDTIVLCRSDFALKTFNNLKAKRLMFFGFSFDWKLSYDELDNLLEINETNWIYVDSHYLSKTLDQSKNYKSVDILRNFGITQQVYLSEIRYVDMDPKCGIVFEQERARLLYLEERSNLERRYLGIPIRKGQTSSRLDENKLKNDPSVYIFCAVQNPRHSLSMKYLYPKLNLADAKNKNSITHIWIEKARIYNEELTCLQSLNTTLKYLTLKDCVCSNTFDQLNRISAGFDLKYLPPNIVGLTAINTKLDVPDEKLIELESLTLINCSRKNSFHDWLNVKQIALIGQSIATPAILLSILKMKKIDTILINGFDWITENKNTVTTDQIRLKGWETDFLLSKSATNNFWIVENSHSKSTTEHLTNMASEFKLIGNHYRGQGQEQRHSALLSGNKMAEVIDTPVDFKLSSEKSERLAKYYEEVGKHCDEQIFMMREHFKNEGYSESCDEHGNIAISFAGKHFHFEEGEMSTFQDFKQPTPTPAPSQIHSVKISNVVLNPATMITELMKLTNIHCISELHLEYVQITDYFPTIHMPNLKYLSISMLSNKFADSLDMEENFSRFLTFFMTDDAERPRSLGDLWNSKTDISFTLDNASVVKINHSTSSVRISKLPFLSKIIAGHENIEKIHIEFVTGFKPQHLDGNKSLKSLSLKDQDFYMEEIEIILKNATGLRNFYLFQKPQSKYHQIRLDRIPVNIRHLSLSSIKISNVLPKEPVDLDILALCHVKFPENFFVDFGKYLNPRRFYCNSPFGEKIGSSSTTTKTVPNYELLYSIVNLNPATITHWFYFPVFDTNFGNSPREVEMKNFLTKAMVDTSRWGEESPWPMPVSLCLEKKNNRWRNSSPIITYEEKYMSQLTTFDENNLTLEDFVFENTITAFDGFGQEVTALKSIDILIGDVDLEFFQNELLRVNLDFCESVKLRCNFLGSWDQFKKIRFPNLKEFTFMDYNHSMTYESSYDYIKSKLIFSDSSMTDLWNLGVNIILYTGHSHIGLEINHELKKLVINFDDGNELLFHASDIQILGFDSRNTNPVIIPKTLVKLEISSPLSWEDFEKCISTHENIQDLKFIAQMQGTEQKISVISRLPVTLKHLTLQGLRVIFKFDKKIQLDSIVFYDCAFIDSKISENLVHLFNVQEIYFTQTDTQMLLNIIKGMDRIIKILAQNYKHTVHGEKFTEADCKEFKQILTEANAHSPSGKENNSSFPSRTLAIEKNLGKWQKFDYKFEKSESMFGVQ